jgi:hypothetical protein
VPGGSTGALTTHGVTWHEVSTNGQIWFQGAALWAATQPADVAAALGNNWVPTAPSNAVRGPIS